MRVVPHAVLKSIIKLKKEKEQIKIKLDYTSGETRSHTICVMAKNIIPMIM